DNGRYIKEAEKDIIQAVKASIEKMRLVKVEYSKHSGNYCARSDSPLIRRAMTNWNRGFRIGWKMHRIGHLKMLYDVIYRDLHKRDSKMNAAWIVDDSYASGLDSKA
ncbi:hypothetical protein Tco_0324373, partial [Tanacetum coccineum]